MIFSAVQKVFAFLMALLVLVSTLSITIEKHYCGDHLVDVAIFSSAKKCGPETPDDAPTMKASSCCKDVVDLIEGQDELSISKSEVIPSLDAVVLPEIAMPEGIALPQGAEKPLYQYYKPPNNTVPIYLWNECYHI
jgi:hypothetical protein